jgi:hypothetical protein
VAIVQILISLSSETGFTKLHGLWNSFGFKNSDATPELNVQIKRAYTQTGGFSIPYKKERQ